MLKKPTPTRARRALGAAITACLALGGGYASWSMQPARATALADATTGSLDPGEIRSFRSIMAPRYPATETPTYTTEYGGRVHDYWGVAME